MVVHKQKNTNFQRKKLIWVSFLILDISLHRTSQIEILKHLADRGYNVYLIAVRSEKRYQLKNSKIHIISIPLRYVPVISPVLFFAILLFLLPLYIISIMPDFIITEPDASIFSFIWVPLLSRFTGSKVILDIRSTPVEVFGLRGHLRTFFFNASVFIAKKSFDGITTLTPLMKKEICSKFQLHPKYVGLWSSGVSTTMFDYEKHIHERTELRRKFGLTNKFVVVYHGYFGVKHGIIESVNSIKILKNRYHDIVLFMLGNGPGVPVLERLIRKNGLQNQVIIHDAVDYADVAKYIAMCDVGIVPLPDLPDWRHQCPLKLLEYLAMKRPVIVTDIPACREIVGNNRCGIYISSSNPTELARAIKYAYKNREQLRELGSHGRAIVEKRYTWEKVARDLENYLLSIDKK